MNILEKTAKRVLGVSGPEDTKYLHLRNAYRVSKARLKLFRDSYPTIVTLEPTTRCNARCRYCPRLKLIRNGKINVGDIENRVLEKIVHELAIYSLGLNHIDLAGFGEPLLHPKIVDIVQLINQTFPFHTPVQITTNGIALTEKLGKQLIDARLDRMLISLNSFSQYIYRDMNGVDAFHKVMLNTVRFLKLKGDRRPTTKIQIMDTDANRPLMNHFQTFWNPRLNRNDKLIVKRIDNMGGSVDHSNYDSRRYQKKRHPCYQLWQNMLISKDGDVYPCCVGEVGGLESLIWIGNVMTEGLHEIINSEVLKAIRRVHRNNRATVIPICKNCNIWAKGPNAWVEIKGKWR